MPPLPPPTPLQCWPLISAFPLKGKWIWTRHSTTTWHSSLERERENTLSSPVLRPSFFGGLLLSRPFPCLCSSLDRISLPHFTWLFDLNSPRLFNNSKVNSTHGGTGDIETATAIDVCVFIDGLFSPSVALRQRCELNVEYARSDQSPGTGHLNLNRFNMQYLVCPPLLSSFTAALNKK